MKYSDKQRVQKICEYAEKLLTHISKNNITKEKVSFDVVVKHLKKLHSISCTNISDFDPFKLIDTYKNIVNNSF